MCWFQNVHWTARWKDGQKMQKTILWCNVLARIYRPEGTINNSCHAPVFAHAVNYTITPLPLILRESRIECSPNARLPLSIMPPKTKKPKLVAGQKTLSFAQGSETSTASPSESTPTTVSTVPRGWDVFGTPSSRRGAVESWRAFAAAKWRNKHPWVVVEEGGVYCLYCKAGTGLLSGSSVFVSTPFTGTRSDKPVQHEHSEYKQQIVSQRAHYWFWGRPKGHIRGTVPFGIGLARTLLWCGD